MADEERLLVSLEARINDFEKKMKKAERQGTKTYSGLQRNSRSATRRMESDMNRATTSINRSLSQASTRIGAFGKTMLTGLAAGAVTAGLSRITTGLSQTVKGIAAVGDQAERAGVSVEAFQELQYAAEQNRIGVESLTDGLKELNLRADEFVTTGKGPAAEAFRRIGYGAEDLSAALENPRELLLEIVNRLQQFDRAAQIRISDELFGGQAGERFVELIRQGEDALRDTIDEARDVGAVMDREMIEKAEELDEKFTRLTRRVANFGKQLAVAVAEIPTDVVQRQLDELFDSEAQGRSILGDQLYDQLSEAGNVAEDQADKINRLTGEYQALREQADNTAAAIQRQIMVLQAWGYDDAAGQLAQAAREMRRLTGEFAEGEITAGQFSDQMETVQDTASSAFDALRDVDQARFSGAIASVDALGGSLAGIVGLAAQVRSALRNIDGGGGDSGVSPAVQDTRERIRRQMEALSGAQVREGFVAAEEERNARTREQLELEREIAQVRERAEDAGTTVSEDQARSLAQAAIAADTRRRAAAQTPSEPSTPSPSGGTSTTRIAKPDLAGEMETIREETRALETEATALEKAARSGTDYGRALEIARAKSELLNAAQRDGVEVPPQLEAQMDRLAQGYVDAGQGVDQLRTRLDEARAAQEDFRSSTESAFAGLVTGAHSLSDALGQVASQLATMAAQSAFRGLFPEGSGGGKGLLGGAIIPGVLHDGGVAGRDGYGHGRSVPASAFVGAPRYHSGGVAGMRPNEVPAVLERGERVLPKGQSGAQRVELMVHADEGVSVEQVGKIARDVSVKVTQQGLGEYDRGLPERVEGIRRDPARRG